jgi:hypothetical protein
MSGHYHDATGQYDYCTSEHAPVFAGHGEKSLTVEVTPAGLAYLHINAAGRKTLVTLTVPEKQALAQALFEPGTTTEIANY